MTEQELRALVRDAIARHQAAAADLPGRPRRSSERAEAGAHPSHLLLPVADGASSDGPCIIEPAVQCNHCGYCKSYGH